MSEVKIAITMGDPAGSGPELTIKALRKLAPTFEAIPILIGDFNVFTKAASIVNAKDLVFVKVEHPREAVKAPFTVNVIDLNNVKLEELVYGKPSPMGGRASYECIVKAVDYAVKGEVDAIVTAPISKESLNIAGYKYPGHTELLADLTNSKEVRMMLVARHLRVVHVTTHVSLRKAIDMIKKDRVLRTIEITDDYLKKYFGIERPVLGIAGLNPHAGEGGLFGDEEIIEIVPAINEAMNKGINVKGPYPPDSVFYRAYYNKEFDAVVAMYHDQGHIPLKMVGFMEGVNITLGLPIIRVSPDHGTVWGKAGTGRGDETATLEAIKIATELAKRKKSWS
ncbi:MAG: 4-hydroxythreonine-4-phosphate dehydrogenase PdxA [Thermosphaera sp.]